MDYMTMNFNRNGGSGTSDYSQLSNKPSINDVTLSGNKTSADLGLMPEYEVDTTPTESSDNLITSGGVWSADKNINNKLQGSKTAGSTDGSPFEIPDYGMTESIAMYFKPTQDLHGYDKPWAGGANINLLREGEAKTVTDNGITFTSDGHGTYTIKGTSTAEITCRFSCDEYVTPDGSQTTMLYGNNVASNNVRFGFSYNNTDVDNTTLNTINRRYTNYSGISLKTINQYYITVVSGTTVDMTIQPMFVHGNVVDNPPAFEPYSNICPISGQDNATFEWTDSHDIESERTMNFGNTYYGGYCQFNGQIYPDWDYIASYNGETLSGEWVSDRDEYQAGTTPTIGAEVAYKTTPSYFRVTPPANLNLTDDYPIEYNGYMASIGYQPKNTVLAEAKRYTNQEIAKLGLPQPPTTDGTYHLECSVSSGIPTIRWVSNS